VSWSMTTLTVLLAENWYHTSACDKIPTESLLREKPTTECSGIQSTKYKRSARKAPRAFSPMKRRSRSKFNVLAADSAVFVLGRGKGSGLLQYRRFIPRYSQM
jgi:hypothetical protein